MFFIKFLFVFFSPVVLLNLDSAGYCALFVYRFVIPTCYGLFFSFYGCLKL